MELAAQAWQAILAHLHAAILFVLLLGSVDTGADLPHDVFGGTLTEIAPSNMPAGGSPQNLNVEFLPGMVRTRGGLQPRRSYGAIAGGPWQVRWVDDYATAPEQPAEMVLLVNPNTPAQGAMAVTLDDGFLVTQRQIGSVTGYGGANVWWAPGMLNPQNPNFTGPLARGCTQFGRKYIAISEGRYGYDLPRQFDGTNFDRVSQCGPGAAPTVQDSGATLAYSYVNPVYAPMTNQPIFEDGNTVYVGGVPVDAWGNALIQAGDVINIPASTVAAYVGTWALSGVEGPYMLFQHSSTGLATGTCSVNLPLASLSVQGEGANKFQQGGTATISGATPSGYDGTFPIRGRPTIFNLSPPIGVVWLAIQGCWSLGESTSGNVAVPGTITAGLHGMTVAFITRQGYITKPAPPVYWTAAGNLRAQVSNIPTGPSNVVARLLLFTQYITPPATTGAFYSIRNNVLLGGVVWDTAMQINDNSTVTATIDFSDSDLAAGFSGDYLFDLVELGECAGCFPYAGRMWWWGELNALPNLLNMSFNGGWQPAVNATKAPSSGSDGGGTHAWTNPGNIGSPTAFASVTSTGTPFVTDALEAEQFGFVLAAPPTGIQIAVKFSGPIGTGLPTLTAQLLKAGAPVGTAKTVWLSSFYLLRTGGVVTFGGPGDLWGAAFTSADVDNAAWGVQFTLYTGSGSGTFELNAASATIYAAPITPLGWTSDATYGAGGAALIGGGAWLDAYQIAGQGTGTKSGMITQPAFQDYLLNPVLAAGASYACRVTYKYNTPASYTTAQLILDVFSPTAGQLGSYSLPCSNQIGLPYATVAQIAALVTMPATAPSDTVIRLYASGLAAGDTFTVDRVEIFPANAPVNYTVLRASRASDPESFDGVTGLIQPVYTSGQAVRTVYTLRDSLYIVCDRSTYVTKDVSGQEPASWPVDTVSSTTGAVGPSAAAAAEDWEVKVNRYGLYLYLGKEPEKISQEIQSLWNKEGIANIINWSAGYKIWATVDLLNKRVYVGAPVGPGAAECNTLFVMDYNFLDNSTYVAELGTLRFSPYTGRRMILDQGRKWTQWTFASATGAGNMPVPCGAFVERHDGTAQFVLGGGADQNLYFIDPTNRGNDNGAACTSFYGTHFAPAQEEEQSLQLRSHMHGFSFARMYVQGAGKLAVNVYRNTFSDPNPLAFSVDLANPSLKDAEETLDEFNAERYAVLWQTNQVGSWFQMERMTLTMEQNPDGLVRGTNLQ